LKAILLALAVVFVWATSWVLIKSGLEDLPALTFAGLRYTLAFLCLLPVAVLRRRRRPFPQLTGRDWIRLAFLGVLLYTVTQGAVFLALSLMEAVTVNLLWSFTTIAVALLAIFFLQERPTGFQWMGIALAAAGAVIYFGPTGLQGVQREGVLVSLLGMLVGAFAGILGREVNRSTRLDPVLVTTISMGVGSLLLLAVGVGTQGMPAVSPRAWVILTWLAVVNTAVAFTLWNVTLQTLSATESSIINGTMIIWIPVLAVLFLGETVSTVEFYGLAATAVGTLIVQLRHPALRIAPHG
jgi:drug/metabolite transporter (DMT)-like permease